MKRKEIAYSIISYGDMTLMCGWIPQTPHPNKENKSGRSSAMPKLEGKSKEYIEDQEVSSLSKLKMFFIILVDSTFRQANMYSPSAIRLPKISQLHSQTNHQIGKAREG